MSNPTQKNQWLSITALSKKARTSVPKARKVLSLLGLWEPARKEPTHKALADGLAIARAVDDPEKYGHATYWTWDARALLPLLAHEVEKLGLGMEAKPFKGRCGAIRHGTAALEELAAIGCRDFGHRSSLRLARGRLAERHEDGSCPLCLAGGLRPLWLVFPLSSFLENANAKEAGVSLMIDCIESAGIFCARLSPSAAKKADFQMDALRDILRWAKTLRALDGSCPEPMTKETRRFAKLALLKPRHDA